MSKIEMSQRNSQKVFQPRDRERKIMLTGRQDYTIPGPSSFQSGHIGLQLCSGHRVPA